MELEQLRVYDPITEEYSYAAYMNFLKGKPKEAHNLHGELMRKVLASEIKDGVKLEDFLWGEKNGYLMQFGYTPVSVIFINGKFHSKYEGRDSLSNDEINAIAKAEDGIPFIFSYDREIDEYLQKQEFFDAMSK